MSRGGIRENAGRKSTWKSGCKFSQTKLIRVPIALVDQLLEIAHKLDSGEVLDLVTKQKSLPITPSIDDTPVISPGQMSLLEQTVFPESDSVTNSKTVLIPLSGRALGRHLNVSRGKISSRKLDPDFEEWTRSIDGTGWVYNEQDKLYYPVK
jgi:hypothetical protein